MQILPYFIESEEKAHCSIKINHKCFFKNKNSEKIIPKLEIPQISVPQNTSDHNKSRCNKLATLIMDRREYYNLSEDYLGHARNVTKILYVFILKFPHHNEK
jgi:hypothetical protein